MKPDNVRCQLEQCPQRPIVVASHRRSGTHLMIDLLRRHMVECRGWKYPGEALNRLYLMLESLYEPHAAIPTTEAKALAILQRCDRPLVKTHLEPENLALTSETGLNELGAYWMNWLKQRATWLYSYRDGRVVMCSLHMFRMCHDASARVSLSEFMRQEHGGLSRPKVWARHVRKWLAVPNVVPLKFEDMVSDAHVTLDHIARSMGLTFQPKQPLLPHLKQRWRIRLDRMIARRPSSTAVRGRYKGRSPQKWHKAFSPQDRRFFHDEAGDLLIELGYETSDAWVTSSKG